jgi:hydrogenase maturation protease
VPHGRTSPANLAATASEGPNLLGATLEAVPHGRTNPANLVLAMAPHPTSPRFAGRGVTVTTLILGIGNTLRGDDGVGPFVLSLLANRGYTLRATHGLLPELAEDIAAHARVVFVDADLTVHEVSLTPLGVGARDALHHFAPVTLVKLARKLGFDGDAWLCRVPVRAMAVGEGLSAEARAAAQEAARLIGELAR